MWVCSVKNSQKSKVFKQKIYIIYALTQKYEKECEDW